MQVLLGGQMAPPQHVSWGKHGLPGGTQPPQPPGHTPPSGGPVEPPLVPPLELPLTIGMQRPCVQTPLQQSDWVAHSRVVPTGMQQVGVALPSPHCRGPQQGCWRQLEPAWPQGVTVVPPDDALPPVLVAPPVEPALALPPLPLVPPVPDDAPPPLELAPDEPPPDVGWLPEPLPDVVLPPLLPPEPPLVPLPPASGQKPASQKT